MSAGFLNPDGHLRDDLVFRGPVGMSAGFFSPDADLCDALVFRVGDQDSPQRGHESRARRLELVLRDVPGETVERRPGPRWLRALLPSLLLNPVRHPVVGIAPPP